LLVGLRGRQSGLQKAGCWFVGGDDLIVSFGRFIAAAVTTTSIILIANSIRNGDILVPANPSPSGKWPLKLHAVVEWS